MSQWDVKLQELKEKQKQVVDLHQQLENAKQEYKAATKAAIGLADGEPLNVLEVAEAVIKIIDLKSRA